MRILIVSHKLIVSGATMTALDLATELVRRGHEVSVFAEPGSMVSTLAERGVGYHEAPGDHSLDARWPSLTTARALRRLVRAERIDVVHTYEWSACLDALLGTHLLDGTPLVSSVMAMRVQRFMPRRVPLVVGTRMLRDELVRRGHDRVELLEPPVDIDADQPSIDGTDFRRSLGIPDDAFVAAIISRLADIKMDSTHIAVEAVGLLAERSDVRLVIVGEGSGEADVRARALAVNERLGRDAVVLTGVIEDPRAAYSGADVILGMGGSALRGLAFAKPVVIVGTHGYSELFTPETSGEYLVQGLWGLGDGDLSADRLVKILAALQGDPARRAELGSFGRQFVCERFALADTAARLEAVLQSAAATPPTPRQRLADALQAMSMLSAVRVQGWMRRRLRSMRRGWPASP